MSNLGEGDDTEWRLLDTVRVEVEVENQGESDLSDIVVELAVFDSSGNEVTGDLNFINSDEEEIEIGKINDGDNEQVTFEFEVSPDFDDGDYRLAIKTYSKKSGLGQDKICDDTAGDLDNGFYQSVSVERETDEGKRIGFSNIKVNPSEATCGDAVQLTLDAINIGDEDEDQVQVTLFNKELGINQFVEIKGGLDQGDSESLSFNFEVPAGLADKTYNLELSADYDYNKGEYRQSLDDVRKISLKVLGCQPVVSTPAATITASLASEAKAGQQLTILATLKNSGTSATSFVVDASGFESWAALGSVSDRIVTLNAGESKDVTVVLNVNSGVSGDKILTVDAKSGAQTISKTVPVSIAASQGISGVSLSGNTMLWVIGAINLILVIVIIIVAIRVSRR